MKDNALVFLAVILAALLLAPGRAPAGEFSVAPQIGTLGFGLNAGWQYSDYLKFRANTNYLPYSRNDTISDVSYKAELDYFTIGALADVHPFAGGFRLSGGLYYVDLTLKAKAKLADEKKYTIGDHEYSGKDLGTWKGTVEWKTLAPYAGLGYGTGSGNEPGFGFSFDLGALYIGKARVNFEAPDSAYQTAAANKYDLQADIDKEENEVKDDIYKYTKGFWPVISLGVIYRF